MAMSPRIVPFLRTVAQMAARLGGVPVLIVIRDPDDRIVHYVGTPGALDNMRADIARKVQVADDADESVTGWEG